MSQETLPNTRRDTKAIYSDLDKFKEKMEEATILVGSPEHADDLAKAAATLNYMLKLLAGQDNQVFFDDYFNQDVLPYMIKAAQEGQPDSVLKVSEDDHIVSLYKLLDLPYVVNVEAGIKHLRNSQEETLEAQLKNYRASFDTKAIPAERDIEKSTQASDSFYDALDELTGSLTDDAKPDSTKAEEVKNLLRAYKALKEEGESIFDFPPANVLKLMIIAGDKSCATDLTTLSGVDKAGLFKRLDSMATSDQVAELAAEVTDVSLAPGDPDAAHGQPLGDSTDQPE